MQIVCIRCILLELCVSGRRKKVRKKERRKSNKIEIFAFDFLNCEKDNGTLEGIFYIRIAEGFHVWVLHHFAVFILGLVPYLKYRTPF